MVSKTATGQIARYADALRTLRNRTVRALTREEHLFAEAPKHKTIVTFLFLELLLAPARKEEIAAEFFECYLHLVEGGKLADLPLTLVPKEPVIRAMRKLLRGDPMPLKESGESPNDGDRDDEHDEEDHDEEG